MVLRDDIPGIGKAKRQTKEVYVEIGWELLICLREIWVEMT